MQELNRLINVSLFNLRSEALCDVQQRRLQFDRTLVKMLINSEISDLIKDYDIECAEADRSEQLKEEYVGVIRNGLSGHTDETTDFLRYIDEYEAMNPDETLNSIWKQTQDSIRRHGLCRKWKYGTSPNEEEHVDYISVTEEYKHHLMKSEAIRKELQAKMELFIESSIQ